jgi:hypothetical protein
LSAVWKYISGVPDFAQQEKQYTIQTKCGAAGKILVSGSSVQAGKTVSFSIQAEVGCALKSFSVVKADSGTPVATNVDGNTYTFKMPASNVIISATFVSVFMDRFDMSYNQTLYKKMSDIDENKWYGAWQQAVIKMACSLGIMNGYEDNTFRPENNISLSEAIKMAAVVRSKYYADKYVFDMTKGDNWYDCYVEYAIANGIIKPDDFTDYTAFATRSEMAYIFGNSLPSYEFAQINVIEYSDISDVNGNGKYDSYVLMLYRAGVIGGYETSAFHGSDFITRAECAAIISRVCLEEHRISGK